MNEVLAVLFYTFETENVSFDSKYFESDLFTVFCKIMEFLRDSFMRELDKEDSGLHGQITHYCEVLNHYDEELYEIIEVECKVPHQFYLLRWYMLLMCQDLSISDIMRLWDCLLAAEGPLIVNSDWPTKRFQYLTYIIVALVSEEKQNIIEEGVEFASCMDNLQKATKK